MRVNLHDVIRRFTIKVVYFRKKKGLKKECHKNLMIVFYFKILGFYIKNIFLCYI